MASEQVKTIPALGERYVNRHTGHEACVLQVGPSPLFDGEVRVLSSADAPGKLDNGWSVEAWHEHWKPSRV